MRSLQKFTRKVRRSAAQQLSISKNGLDSQRLKRERAFLSLSVYSKPGDGRGAWLVWFCVFSCVIRSLSTRDIFYRATFKILTHSAVSCLPASFVWIFLPNPHRVNIYPQGIANGWIGVYQNIGVGLFETFTFMYLCTFMYFMRNATYCTVAHWIKMSKFTDKFWSSKISYS